MFNRYFKQRTTLRRDEVFKSKNVILSGWNSKDIKPGWGSWMNCDYNEQKKALLDRYIDFDDAVKKQVEEMVVKINPEACLGLYLRGTDYIKQRPLGHPVQPTLADVRDEVERIMREEGLKRIFLVSEDAAMRQDVEIAFGDIVQTIDGDIQFQDNGQPIRKVIEKNMDINDANMIYLVKMILLAKCHSFVGGRTNGSMFSCALNGGTYKQRYIYDRGYY